MSERHDERTCASESCLWFPVFDLQIAHLEEESKDIAVHTIGKTSQFRARYSHWDYATGHMHANKKHVRTAVLEPTYLAVCPM